jgi:glucose/mannose-6-phosphate isomerase
MDPYYDNIVRFPAQLGNRGLTVKNLAKLRGAKPDAIIILGMGGSGLAGEILKAAAQELKIRLPILLWKDYGLPYHGFSRPLFIVVSFSGTTEEPVSGLRALPKNSRVGVVASSGTLMTIAQARALPLVTFPAGHLTPRQSVGTMFYAIIELLRAADLVSRVPSFFKLSARSSRKPGERLARKLYHKLIFIYTDTAHAPLGYIWKIKFNETSKVHAFSNVIPEMNHNELTAFDAPPKGARVPAAALFLCDSRMPPRLAKRFRITRALMRLRGADVILVPLTGKTFLEQAWRTLLFADWTSYFLGKQNGIRRDEFSTVNPKIVIDLKQKMG